MKSYSSTKPDTYQVLGATLRIHWDAKEITRESMDGQPETQWEANEAVCVTTDSRHVLIEKIIGSIYSTGAELAAINNKDNKPSDYAEYQTLRVKAKNLADGWLNK